MTSGSLTVLVVLLVLGLVPGLAAPGAERRDDLDAREALEGLQRELRTGGKWERVSAVEKAARLGTHAGWELVVGALDDRAGEVADTAQLVLGRADDPWLLERLEGRDGLRSRDEWVRLRVVEVLGRVPCAVDAALLARTVADRDAEVRRTALWSLERQARAGHLAGDRDAARDAAAKRLRSDRDVAVRGRALVALCALAPGRAADAVRTALEDRAPGLRAVAASLVPEALTGAARDAALVRAAADGSRLVRGAAVDALAAIGTAPSMRALAGRLAVEETERLRWRLVERLRAASGRKHRFDPRPWVHWAAQLPDGWVAAPGVVDDDEGAGAAPFDRSAAQFAGLPLRSRRLCFLIDLSGSIWTERADGRTPKQLVDERLREALERLPEDARFNVIPYTSEPRPWADELQPATRANVRKAAEFFESRRDRGTGNFWDAALLALEDPDVDTLVVLTDGAPTGGRRYCLELMIPLFVERNATRGVAVDSVLVGAPRGLQERWAELARLTGGQSTVFPLE